MNTTPMMQQYHDAKEACPDALLLFRMGDFYELFYEDAKTAASCLGLTLTSRDKGEDPIPMAGFPHHQLESYLGKIIAAGHRAAVCEQVEDPRKAKGLVKREVTRVVTPGTITDESLLDPRESNYLAALAYPAENAKPPHNEQIGLAWADLSTGRFFAGTFDRKRASDQLASISPKEILVADDATAEAWMTDGDRTVTTRPKWAFAFQHGSNLLKEHFETLNLEGFGFDDHQRAPVRAAGAILDYLLETQKAKLAHIDRLTPYQAGAALEIDESSRRSLELTRTLRDGKRDGSLISVLDRCVTSMGSRLLADWLNNPLTRISTIDARLDAVGELKDDSRFRSSLRDQLRRCFDLERLLARVTTGRVTPRDLSCIGRTLSGLPKLKALLTARRSPRIQELEAELDLCPDVRSQLDAALIDDCPQTAADGGFIRAGFHSKLDELRQLAAGGKEWIAKYQAKEAEQSGIPNLKVGFNKVFGYYIELSNAHREKAPSHYIRKQTLKNAERFITPELKEYEEKVLAADEQVLELELEVFDQIRELVHASARRLRATAQVIAQLDVLASLAELAAARNYCRPQLVEQPLLQVEEGRHPVLDSLMPQGSFVPNGIHAGENEGSVLLITGPNMAGKSTYIRQAALLTVMAQMGGFTPAKSALMGVADRVFARVGASDELSRGQSTFMVEMTETARILNNATSRSLVVLDEIGRGTSTYDGVSLAWAIVEHIHDHIGCRTLFATHYHELTDLEHSLEGVKNFNVSVKEWEDKVVFLHKIVRGAADKSYGIHVARLAGVPRSVNERAKQILAQLEAEHLDDQGRPKASRRPKERPKQDIQLTLFGFADHPLLEKVRNTNINSLTPLEALNLLKVWQQELGEK